MMGIVQAVRRGGGLLLLGMLLPVMAAGLSACAHDPIPGTTVEDTAENREILKVVEAYQQAIEHRDSEALMALVSPRFFEDNGNTDRTDDYDYRGLKSSLPRDFSRTKAMQLVVRVDDVRVNEDTAYAEIFYSYRAQSEYPSGLQWDSGSDRARIRLQKSDGRWLIVAGL
jgi:hypothetical protein